MAKQDEEALETQECWDMLRGIQHYTLNRTPYGISHIEIVDRNERKCSLQNSSITTENCIWLGVYNTGPLIKGPNGDFNANIPGVMHMTQTQVASLLPFLQRFVETGSLFEEETREENGKGNT